MVKSCERGKDFTGGATKHPDTAPTNFRQTSLIFRASGRLITQLGPLLVILLSTTIFLWHPQLSAAAPPGSSQTLTTLPEPASFDLCVHQALKHSPFLTKSSLELEVRRLDEWDSRAAFLPSISVRFKYYAAKPGTAAFYNPAEYVVEVYSDNYNPIASYYNLQAQKIATRIAIQSHLKVIGEVLQALGQSFLELAAMQHLAGVQGELVDQAQKKVNYCEQRLRLGELTPLEVQVASQELELAKAEADRLIASQTKTVTALKKTLGLKPEEALSLDLKEVRQQVLGTFAPVAAKLEEARSKSPDLKIKSLIKELQAWNVTLAKIKFLPDIYLGFQTPDPLALANVEGLFFAVGLTWNVPFLDGFKKVRNVTRQKVILKQAEAEVHTKEIDIEEKWRAAQDKVKSSQTALKIAQSQEELAQLKDRQGELRYHAGDGSYDMLVAGRQAYLNAKINTIVKKLEYDLAVLQLYHLSGDLVSRYISENAFRQ